MSSLVSQALFCQSGKSVQVKNKALALRNSQEHMNIEASLDKDAAARICGSGEKLNGQFTPILTSEGFLLKKAKCDSLRGHPKKCSVLLTACVAMAIPC
ncbi:hypothetical protein [Umezakia ovalisporum]|uniref:Uncharacterized protein n=1 Tax=Umezakia ovalisporum FSS-43 TaxID=2740520 RepID=A0ABT6K8W7_9CYAN|nr:hypothetical protein [Umezakia ovalisporum]MBI1242462.1 hypothetical protein [Nostoc sp. RI_552]MDH6058818.1 hypothetical protein [Umezakia ovalisporum FSS-43]MDH6068349.1 hypothetical protein [Umezakia ovalisporum APH033B]MDH6073112.1 hypothetical protein [Umezakia ovalisporum CS-1034]MDH6079543.1 hypothetical protein [Umezakia ovalisporum FSS-45]